MVPAVSEHVLTQLRRLRLPWPIKEFLAFGYKQARSAIFAGTFFGLLFITTKVDLPIPRYDFVLLGAIAIQVVLLVTKRESTDELKMIMVFHVLGFILESYKTHPSIGSWAYPEDAWTKVGSVPLYSGFMYSAIGSYMAQAWRLFDLDLVRYPKPWVTAAISAAVYINFFTNAFVYDIRWFLIAIVIAVFGRTRVYFTPLDRRFWMPVWTSFGLIAFFVWVAENISTLFGAWQYPNQAEGWDVVEFDKITSWSLLVIVSFVLVAQLKFVKRQRMSAL